MCRFYSCLSNGILDWKFQFILSKCCVRKDKNTLKIIKRKCAHSSVCSICWASKNEKIMTASKIALRFCYNHEKNLYFLVSNMCKFQWFKRFNTSSIFATLKWILQNVTIIFLLQFFLYEIFVVLTKIASFKVKKRERNICITYVKKTFRSSRPEVFLVKGVLEMCSRFTGEHPCRSVISIKLQSIFIEIALRHGCSPVNLLHILRTPFPRNTSGWLLLDIGD